MAANDFSLGFGLFHTTPGLPWYWSDDLRFVSSISQFFHNKKAAAILISANEWPGVHLATADFAADIRRVTDVESSITNLSSPLNFSFSLPIIVGTLEKSSLIQQVLNSTGLECIGYSGKLGIVYVSCHS